MAKKDDKKKSYSKIPAEGVKGVVKDKEFTVKKKSSSASKDDPVKTATSGSNGKKFSHDFSQPSTYTGDDDSFIRQTRANAYGRDSIDLYNNLVQNYGNAFKNMYALGGSKDIKASGMPGKLKYNQDWRDLGTRWFNEGIKDLGLSDEDTKLMTEIIGVNNKIADELGNNLRARTGDTSVLNTEGASKEQLAEYTRMLRLAGRDNTFETLSVPLPETIDAYRAPGVGDDEWESWVQNYLNKGKKTGIGAWEIFGGNKEAEERADVWNAVSREKKTLDDIAQMHYRYSTADLRDDLLLISGKDSNFRYTRRPFKNDAERAEAVREATYRASAATGQDVGTLMREDPSAIAKLTEAYRAEDEQVYGYLNATSGLPVAISSYEEYYDNIEGTGEYQDALAGIMRTQERYEEETENARKLSASVREDPEYSNNATYRQYTDHGGVSVEPTIMSGMMDYEDPSGITNEQYQNYHAGVLLNEYVHAGKDDAKIAELDMILRSVPQIANNVDLNHVKHLSPEQQQDVYALLNKAIQNYEFPQEAIDYINDPSVSYLAQRNYSIDEQTKYQKNIENDGATAAVEYGLSFLRNAPNALAGYVNAVRGMIDPEFRENMSPYDIAFENAWKMQAAQGNVANKAEAWGEQAEVPLIGDLGGAARFGAEAVNSIGNMLAQSAMGGKAKALTLGNMYANTFNTAWYNNLMRGDGDYWDAAAEASAEVVTEALPLDIVADKAINPWDKLWKTGAAEAIGEAGTSLLNMGWDAARYGEYRDWEDYENELHAKGYSSEEIQKEKAKFFIGTLLRDAGMGAVIGAGFAAPTAIADNSGMKKEGKNILANSGEADLVKVAESLGLGDKYAKIIADIKASFGSDADTADISDAEIEKAAAEEFEAEEAAPEDVVSEATMEEEQFEEAEPAEFDEETAKQEARQQAEEELLNDPATAEMTKEERQDALINRTGEIFYQKRMEWTQKFAEWSNRYNEWSDRMEAKRAEQAARKAEQNQRDNTERAEGKKESLDTVNPQDIRNAEQTRRDNAERAEEGKREDTSDFVPPDEWHEVEQAMRDQDERSDESKDALELDDANAVEQAKKKARERAERAEETKDTLGVDDVDSVAEAERNMRERIEQADETKDGLEVDDADAVRNAERNARERQERADQQRNASAGSVVTSEQAKTARDKGERKSKGKRSKVSPAKVGQLYRASMAKLDAQAQEVLSTAYARTLEGQLSEKGITGDAAKAISKQLADAIGGREFTPYIRSLITNNATVRQIYMDSMAKVETAESEKSNLEYMAAYDHSKFKTAPKAVDPEDLEADEIKVEAEEGDTAAEIVTKNAAKYLGEQAATMENMYNAETQDAAAYSEAFVRAVNYGRDGRNLDVVKGSESLSALTAEQVQAAYTIGQEMRRNAPTAVRVNSKGVTVGKVDLKGINLGSLNKHQKASVHAAIKLAKTIGFNIKFVESKADMLGQYVDENGSWQPDTMTLTLDIHAGSNSVYDVRYAMMHTMGHELTHFIKQFADGGMWNDYQAMVMDHLSTKMSTEMLDNEIAKRIAFAKKKGVNLTRDGAIEEIIADASVEALNNITEADLAQIADTNPGLLKKIGQFIQKWVKDIKAAINAAYSGTESKTELARAMEDQLDEFSKKWNQLLVNAAQNRRAAEANGNYDTTAEAAIMEATDGAENADGDKLFSLRTMQEDRAEFRQMLIRHGKMSAAQVNELFQTIDRLMEEIEKKRAILDFGADIDSDSRSFTPVKPNSDPLYQVSVDFFTLCRKRLLQQVCQERLEEEMDRAVTKAERVAIRDELIKLQQQGKQIEVACALCYVESARLKSPAQIQRFIDNRANVIREYFAKRNAGIKAEMQRAEAEYREANGIGDEPLKNLPGNVAKKVRAAKNAPIANYQVSAEEQKTIDKAMSMGVSDFTTADSLWALKRSDPVLFDIYTSYIRNATKSKGIEGDTPWKAGDSKAISDELIRKMNEENGLRSQSWSDFQTYHILDYIASIIELSTRNAKMQAYSKVPAYVKLMGETGVMINMSLIPEAKFDGTLKYDGVEGIVPEEAFELRKRFPDTAGTICIGIADTQIRMLLASDDIDYVIAYHRSGMDAATRRKMHIPTWKDYEKYQNEKPLSKDAGKAPKFSEWFDYETAVYEAEKANNTPEGEAAIANGDVMYGAKIAMQKAAQRYKDLCAARNLAPKFQDFANEAGYWKLLIDRKMINNITGEIIEQKAVQPVFKEGTLIEICKDEVSRFEQNNADFNDAVDAVIEAYKNGTLGKAAKSAKVQQQIKAHEDWVTVQAVVGTQEQAQDDVKYQGRMSESERNRALRKGEMINEFRNVLKGEWSAYYDKINNDPSYNPDRFYDGEGSCMIIGDKLLILEMQRNGEFSVIDVYKSDAFAYNNDIDNKWFEDRWRDNGYDEKTLINWIATFANDVGEEVPQRYDRMRKRFVPVEQGQERLRDGDDRLYRSRTQRTGVLETSAKETEADLKLQARDLSELSDRELLVQALEGELTEAERDHLNRYKARVDELGEKQMKLEELNSKIAELKANGATTKTSEELRAAQTNAKTLRDSIARVDAKLNQIESAKMIQEVVKRNRAEARKSAYALARERADERQRKAVEHAREVGQRKVDRLKESHGKEKYKAQILADVKKLHGWLTTPSMKGSVPKFLAKPVADFLESIDFTSSRALKGGEATKSDAKFADALEQLRRAVGEINKQQGAIEAGAADFAGYIDLPADYMAEFDELVGKIKVTLNKTEATDIPFNRMTADQLHELSKMFRILNSSISKTNRLIANGRYESAKTASNETIDDMNSMKAKLKTNKALESLNSIFNWKNTTPYYAFQRLGRGGKAIFEGLQDGWDKMARNSATLIEFAKDTFDGKESKEWSRDVSEVTLSSGDVIQMTTAQKMSLYCHSKRAQSMGHLMGGGIRMSDIDGKRGATISQVDNYVLSEADIRNIIGSLTARQKAVADALQKFMNTVCKDWGNEISMKRFGYEQMTEDNYFPIETDANNRARIDDTKDGGTSMFRLLNMSALKPLTPKANNAIIIRNIFDVFSDHSADMAKYNALALPILDYIKWYNYVERTDVVDASGQPTGQIKTRSTQKALERAYGVNAKQYLNAFIKDLNAEHDGGRNDGAINKMISRSKVASVGANLRVYFLQITSLPRAAYAINPKYLMKGLLKLKSLNPLNAKNGTEAQEEIGILKWKDLGFYSTDINNSVRDMVKRDGAFLDNVRNWQMVPAGWGDNWVGNIIYEAAKAETADRHPSLKPGSDAYNKMLNKRVREIVYKTQVVDSTMTRSDFMRSKGLSTVLTAFMSEPTLTVNMLNEGIQEAIMKKRGLTSEDLNPGGKIGKAFATFAVTATMTAALEAVFDAFRDDDDYEEFLEKYLSALKGNIIDNMNVFAMLPILKDAFSIIVEGYENNSLITQTFSNARSVIDTISEYKENKRPAYAIVYDTLKLLSSLTGYAIANATRDVVSIYNTVMADAFNAPKLQTYSDSKSNMGGQYYNALTAGDTDKAEWILERAEVYGKDAGDMESKVNELAKEDYLAGNIDDKTALEMMTKHGGKKAKNAESALLTWKYEKETGGKYSNLEEEYTAGTITKQQAIDYLVKYGGKKRDDAEEQVNKWKYEADTGNSYSDIKDDYISGDITEAQLRKYLSDVEGLDSEKIEDRISQYDYTAYTGKTTTAPKYWRLVYTYETGGNYKAYADELFDEIMSADKKKSWKQARSSIASSIASYYKKDYLAIKGTPQGDKMLEEILDVYEAIGYARGYERKYIAEKWKLED